jgi:TonB-linked SusC/RagA family outer membrane protein
MLENLILRMGKTFDINSFINRYNKFFVMDIRKMKTIAFKVWLFFYTILTFNFNKRFFKEMNVVLRLNEEKRLSLCIVLLFFCIFSVSSQVNDTILVKGKVINSANIPVPNVSVAVEGSFELPSITDELGEFSIKTLSGNVWLNIAPSSLYKSKRVFLNNRSELIIYLTNEDLFSGFDEVTVLSQQRIKRNFVASFSELTTENIRLSPSLTIDQYMQGRISGLHVMNRSGHPGSGAYTILRGINSVNASNQPTYIVDGIPVPSFGIFGSNLDGYFYNPLLGVNNLDISKVAVIKDPLITSAYGLKASNGLILIETLIPSATQTVIELDLRSGYSLSPSNLIPQLNNQQHKTLVSELLFSSGKNEELIQEEYPNLYLTSDEDRFIDYQHNTNWQEIIFNNALFSNLNLNVKGGDEIARYGLSYGYMNANGIIRNSGYEGNNLRFVSLLNIFSWLKMNAGVSLSYNISQLKESARMVQTNPIITSLGKSPMLNPFQYDQDGNQLKVLAPVDELGVSNPKAIIDNYEASNNNFLLVSTLGLEASLKENLVLNTKFGLTYNILKELIFMPNQGMESYYNNEAINVSKGTDNSLSSFYNNTYLIFNQKYGNDHYLTFNTGVNFLSNNFEMDWALTKNAHENDQYRMLQDGSNNLREIGGAMRNWKWLSFYENVTYQFQDKYIISGTLSLNGSSRIGENAKNTIRIGGVPIGIFYAGGLGWHVSSEPFLKNASWLEELKLRLTYGLSGNDDIGESNATKYYNAIKYRETAGLYPALLSNDELSYEKVKQINFGSDVSLWGARLSTSFDIYKSEISDMLIYRPLKAYFGYDFRPENVGRMQNKGVDLGFFFRIINRPAFTWDIQSTISFVKNQVKEMDENKIVTSLQGAEIVNMPGETANSFYGYIYEGVYSTSSEAENAGLVNERLISYTGGDAIFSDISGPNGYPDGVINSYDKTVIGSSLPGHFGGLSNTFSYKRWSVNIFLQYIAKNEVFNYLRYQNERMTGLNNQSINVLNRWQSEGHKTIVPRALWNDPVGNSSFSSRWIEDGSFLRVKSISLSYTIAEYFLAFRNAQFYITGNNIFTFSKYLGYDPEFGYSHTQIDQGIDYGLTPQPRQFIIGVKLGL